MQTLKATVGVALLLSGCTSTTQVASHYAKSQLVTAAEGGTVTVTAADDSALANTSVEIPANALAANTTITIAEGAAVPVPVSGTVNGQAAGPVADFGPANTTFSIPVTITLPLTLPSGASVNTVEVVAVGDSPATIPNASLTIDPSGSTVSFQVTSFARFGCVAPPAQTCPSGDYFCGCPGYGGECIPSTSVCALNCPIEGVDGGASICPPDQGICCGVCAPGVCPSLACSASDAGSGCAPGSSYCGCLQQCVPSDEACPACAPLDGGSALCPPGETPCCPGDPSSCAPSGVACAIACTVADGGSFTCPPGDYFCGCPGLGGTCIPNQQACALNCPNEPADGGLATCEQASDCNGPLQTLCAVCADGSTDCYHWDCVKGFCQDSICEDGGGIGTGAGDGGSTSGCGPGTSYCPCENACLPSNEACPDCEIADGGSSLGGDAGTCPPGDFFCGCPGYGGTCDPLGTVCAVSCPAEGVDGGAL